MVLTAIWGHFSPFLPFSAILKGKGHTSLLKNTLKRPVAAEIDTNHAEIRARKTLLLRIRPKSPRYQHTASCSP